MERQAITFSANEQNLIKTGGIDNYASNTVSYVVATFDLGENWDEFDSIRAVFSSDYETVPAVLAHDSCLVPFEVLRYRSTVRVNLVGSVVVAGALVDRLTSFPITALTVTANAKVDNSIAPISPSEFEEFVAMVKADADRAEAGAESAEDSAEGALASAQAAAASALSASNSASDASASAQTAQEEAQKITGMVVVVTQLPEGATPTSDWSNGVLTIGIPKGDTGETGATGNGIESAVLNANYTLTLTFTDGTSYTTPSIRGATGATGATGNGISSVTLTSTSGAVKTYTIAFTDGTNTTFDVTDGEVTQAVLDEEITALKSDLNFKVNENTNATAGKNLFDLKTWLTRNTITYTESSGAVIFTPKSAILSDPFILADDDIEVIVNVSMSSEGNTYLIFKDKNGTNVLTGSSITNKTIKCSKILMNWSSGKETTATVSVAGVGKSNDTLAAEVEPLTDKVENSIDRYSFNLLEGYTPSESTLLNYSTGETSSSTGFFTYEDIDVSDYNGGMLHTYSSYMAGQGQTTYSRFAFYDSSHNYISGQNPNESSGLGAPIPSTAKYLSVCFAYTNGNVLDGKPDVIWASPILQQKQTAFALDNDLSYNKKSDVFMPYKGKRKGIITITIDGDFDYNPRIVGVAEKHGMRIGIAPPYTTDFAYNGIKLYKMWEDNGHEILVHGRYNIGSDSPYSDAQIAEFIEAARDTMDTYGFNVHGYVAYQGNSKASSREVIKDYFDYGYTASNHSGSQAAPNDESCCFISSVSPYFMFRYSMQTSTLAQQKAAVDRCVETGGLLTFYGHAESANNDYFTPSNFDELLTYIETKDVEVVTPYVAMQKFYTLRSADLFESISDISGQMTVNENFTVITADAFYIPTLHLCSLDLRLRCNNPSGVNTGGSFSFVSGLPFTRTRFYIDSNPSNLETFMYEGSLRTMASVAIANNADIYLSGVFYANRY